MSEHKTFQEFKDKKSIKIFKYKIENRVVMPVDAEIIDFKIQNTFFTLWALVDSEAETKTRYFRILETGESIESDYKYIATTHEGDFVWHLFEKGR